MLRILTGILVWCFVFCLGCAIDNFIFNNAIGSAIEQACAKIFKKKNLDPCDCALAFTNQDQSKMKKCDEYYNSLNETEKEIWTQTILNCGSVSINYQNTDELPTHITEKINEYSKLNNDYEAIPQSSNLFGEEEYTINKRRFEILEKMLSILNQIDSEGYSNKVPNFSNVLTSTNLRLEGIKLQIEAANEINANKTDIPSN